MRWKRCLALFLVTALLILSGCGTNGGSATMPLVINYSIVTAVLTKGVAATLEGPMINGSVVTGYSIVPTLPAGLLLDPRTGVISGTPKVVAAKSTYTVTATGASGNSSATLTITVNDQAPRALTYAAGTASYTVAVSITPNYPANAGGAIVSYEVNPGLPPGLVLSTTTGVISGQPSAEMAAAKYTFTATNTGGSTTAVITISVKAAQSASRPQAPAGLTYHPGSAIYTVGVPVPQNVPTSAGGAPLSYTNSLGVAVPAYSVSPALPAGLRISGTAVTLADNATGVISGTPTAASSLTTYTVTASNASGSTTATLDLAVNTSGVSPTGLAYTTPAPVFSAGVRITPDAPLANPTIATGSTFGVSPDLPSGLSLDPSTGIVSGTPNPAPSNIVPPPPLTSTYTVTVTSPQGNTTAPLTITLFNSPQAVPNMAQSITPLDTPGSNFQFLDTGMVVTDSFDPRVAPKEWLAGQAVSTSISPDGDTLLVLTSGYNRVFQGPFPLFDPLYSSEYVFIFDISHHSPVFRQALPIPNAYHGIVWDPVPGNRAFYVSGGMGDAPFGTDPIPNGKASNGNPIANNGDNVHIIMQLGNGAWVSAAELDLGIDNPSQNPPRTVVQGHPSGNGLPVPNNQFASVNSAVYVAPMAAGLAISNDGQVLVVANYYNDSITVFTGGLSAWLQQWVPDSLNPNVPPLPYSAQGGRGTMQGTELRPAPRSCQIVSLDRNTGW